MLSKDLATFTTLQLVTASEPDGEDATVPLDPESEAMRWDAAYGVTPQDGYRIAQELESLG